MTRAYRALLFDLFGTVVHFRAAVPAAGTPVFEWLRGPLTRVRPDLAFDAFAPELLAVSRDIVAERAPAHREVPSRERFRRALARLDPHRDHSAAAEALSLAHMAHLAAQTELPPGHRPLLRELGERYRLGLVSNFDHGPTARAILERHRVAECFAAVVISDDIGVRKPHPAIFATALDRLATAPADALYIGDSHDADVVGALAAGMDVAWIDRTGVPAPAPAPTYVLRELAELRSIVDPG